MVNKVIKVGTIEVPMRASAATPRFYRNKIGRDLFNDMRTLKEAADKVKGDNKIDLSMLELEVFENVAYVMAWTADVDENGNHLHNVADHLPTAEENIGAWLESIDGVFSVYEALPQILDLWQLNNLQMSDSKKKVAL